MKYRLLLLTSVIPVILLLTSKLILANEISCTHQVAKVISLQGKVEFKHQNSYSWHIAKTTQTLCSGDLIKVHKHSRAVIYLTNDTVIRLDENTQMVLQTIRNKEKSWLKLIQGIVHFISRTKKSLTIETPFVNAAIEGTEFIINTSQIDTQVIVFQGKVLTSNTFGKVLLTDNQSIKVKKDQPPRKVTLLNPRNSVQWGVYIPPLLDFAHLDSKNPVVKTAINEIQNGNFLLAITQLEADLTEHDSAETHTILASLMLSTGRINEANSHILQSLHLTPNDVIPYALQAMISVVNGNPNEAEKIINRAKSINSQSVILKLVQSYIEQLNFNYELALRIIQEASKISALNVHVRTRLAELLLVNGEYDAALIAIKKALELDEGFSYAHTINGFLHLFTNQIDLAESSFARATRLDSSTPLSHLGLAISKIRHGQLSEGIKQLEIAASLNPNESLLRSYLGKAYIEQNRVAPAETELKNAMLLDKADPTPHLYYALLKQSLGQPIEAINSLNQSIKLNNNRAIYRSKLLIDADQASRNASLGKIYQSLGLERPAFSQAWKSLSQDPNNASAHRLLAEGYSRLPRHEIARTSELLQSQLNQAVSNTPSNPQLAETELIRFEGAGPALPSINEYNSLFIQNGMRARLSGSFGTQQTLGDEVTISGLKDRFSASFSQYYWDTNGYRENSNVNRKLYDAFAQYAYSPNSNIQAEYRKNDIKQGELALKFGADPLPKFDRTDTSENYRFGMKHSKSQRMALLTSIIFNKIKSTQKITKNNGDSLDVDRHQKNMSIELQAHLTLSTNRSILGLSDLQQDDEINTNISTQILLPSGDPIIVEAPTIINNNIANERKFYFYNYFQVTNNFTLTTGINIHSLERDAITLDEFNPKIGLQWSINSFMDLRASALKSTRGIEAVTQTIEPTQIAGFNQFYNDIEASKIRQYGLAMDYQLGSKVSSGWEFVQRNLKSPRNSAPPYYSATEKYSRVYFNWIIMKKLVFNGEYYREELTYDEKINRGIIKATTHKIPLSLRYFSSKNMGFRITTTAVKQSGDFDVEDVGKVTLSGSDRFWLLDLGFDYRFAKRKGLLSASVINLLDKQFKFQDTDPNNQLFWPKRVVAMKVSFLL